MIRLVLGAAIAALVAACGGGGGGSELQPPPAPPPNARLELVAGASGGSGSADGAYANARLSGPVGITTDGAGTIYVTEPLSNRIRRAVGGVVSKFPTSQTGAPGFVDGLNALFYQPSAIAASSGGTAYVADTYNHAIRQIDAAGNTTTLAGSAERGYADGTGAAARFLFPQGIVRDATGNLFVLDTGNAAIRRVTPAGVVTTFAGNPNLHATIDGQGTAASFFIPTAIAIDATGNLYVADNGTIRFVTSFGLVTTLAGASGQLQVVDGPSGTARFGDIGGIAVANDATVFVTENVHNVIRQRAPSGLVTTVAGTLDATGSADGAGAAARFNHPAGITVDAGTGNLLIADTDNHTIRLLTRAGSVLTLIGAAPPRGATDGAGAAARFGFVTDLALDVAGNVLVADWGNFAIRRLDATNNVQTIAGVLGSNGTQDGPAGTGRFMGPGAVASDGAGNLYVVDTQTFFCHTPLFCESNSSAIRRVDPAGTITTLAGDLALAGDADGTGTAARFRAAVDIAIDSAGNLYVSDFSSATIRRVTPAGVVTTIAGSPRLRSHTDGTGSQARFLGPRGLVIDRDGNLFVADGGSMIRKVTPAGVVTTIAGTATPADGTDGNGAAARFASVNRLAIDSDGNLYATDASTIRKITPTGVVTTVAGTKGQDGFTPGRLPGVVTPRSLVVKGTDLYIGIDSGIAVLRNRP
ncbi:hypothetical protein DSM104443_00215 [Usitatibacter rugosus]|uniref:NHL repeat-containing protein n=1 Tax=Usitatibacter rugosus TaxID=2732067 RepID=A0A6M4GPB6_9PROT|nr:hypothetical protein [Usitatibacter rugosus]QJR09179.1 hypothetical protein DSM104443_00215 [Usitatibacter rugosus]